MYKQVFALSLVVSALFACSTEDDDVDDSSFSRELTYKVTDENAQTALDVSMESVDASDDINDPSEAESILPDLQSSNMLTRATESGEVDCLDSGSASFSVTGDEAIDAEGSLAIDVDYDNCQFDGYASDGGLSITMAWSDYGETNNVTLTYDELSLVEDGITSRIDGNLSMLATSTEYQMSWDFYMATAELDNQMVHTYTTQDIQGTYANDSLTAGAWRVDGAENTYVEFEVDPDGNGIYVTVNGDETGVDLVPWR